MYRYSTDAGATLVAMAPAPGTSAYAKRPAPCACKTELNPALPKQQQSNNTRGLPATVELVHANAGGAGSDVGGSNPSAGNELERDVRYMRDRISDKVDMLETRLSDFAAEVEKAYPGLNCGGAVYAASQDDVTVVGRVVCDSEGKLNEASVQLEGEAHHQSSSPSPPHRRCSSACPLPSFESSFLLRLPTPRGRITPPSTRAIPPNEEQK